MVNWKLNFKYQQPVAPEEAISTAAGCQPMRKTIQQFTLYSWTATNSAAKTGLHRLNVCARSLCRCCCCFIYLFIYFVRPAGQEYYLIRNGLYGVDLSEVCGTFMNGLLIEINSQSHGKWWWWWPVSSWSLLELFIPVANVISGMRTRGSSYYDLRSLYLPKILTTKYSTSNHSSVHHPSTRNTYPALLEYLPLKPVQKL